MERNTGSGPIRINTPLVVRDDLYSKLFVSSFHAEYIHKCTKKVEHDASIKEKACNDHEFFKTYKEHFAMSMGG